jgi:hypothetical protein
MCGTVHRVGAPGALSQISARDYERWCATEDGQIVSHLAGRITRKGRSSVKKKGKKKR